MRVIQGKAKNSFHRGSLAGDWLLLEVRGSGILPVTSEDSGEPAPGGSGLSALSEVMVGKRLLALARCPFSCRKDT